MKGFIDRSHSTLSDLFTQHKAARQFLPNHRVELRAALRDQRSIVDRTEFQVVRVVILALRAGFHNGLIGAGLDRNRTACEKIAGLLGVLPLWRETEIFSVSIAGRLDVPREVERRTDRKSVV